MGLLDDLLSLAINKGLEVLVDKAGLTDTINKKRAEMYNKYDSKQAEYMEKLSQYSEPQLRALYNKTHNRWLKNAIEEMGEKAGQHSAYVADDEANDSNNIDETYFDDIEAELEAEIEEWKAEIDNIFEEDEISDDVRGNSTGNIANDGLVAVKGEWVYYSNKNDSGRLYKMRTNGNEKQKLSNDRCRFINAGENWVYYCNNDDNFNLLP